MKQYTIELIVTEGYDEFWDDINNNNSTGCEEILIAIKNSLNLSGWTEGFGCSVKLKEFKDI